MTEISTFQIVNRQCSQMIL